MTSLQPGAQVGDYVLERALGRGGMASVFAARHRETGIERAIKVVGSNERGLRGERRRERFAREARALAKLDRHPNVVGVHEYGELPDGRGYCVLDYVDGGDLDGLLAGGRLEVDRAVELGAGIARALEHVHAQGVVHRDLKPGNVLLAGDGRPILTDFGIARDDAEERMTHTQALLGTPHYMSPEQATGSNAQVGPPSDVFSLGVVLYQLLSGELPFFGETALELTRAILCDPPTPLSASREDLPRGLEGLVGLCLEKEPERRPTAGQVAEQLERLGRGESIDLRPASGLGRFARRVADRRVVIGLTLVGVVGLTLVARWGQGWIERSRADEAWRRGVLLAVQESKEARQEAERWSREARGGPDRLLEALVRAEVALEELAAAPRQVAEADELRAEREQLRVALALLRVEQALLRGDARAAREGLRGLPREGPCALAVAEAALVAGDVVGAARLLAAAPASPRRTRLSVRLEAARADRAARRFDVREAVAALRRARDLDRDAFPATLRAAVAQVVERWGKGGERAPQPFTLLEAYRVAFGSKAFPASAARLYLAAAQSAQRAKDYDALTERLSRAAELDARLPIPRDLSTLLILEGKDLLRTGRTAQGFALLLHASRSGYETLGKNLLRQLIQQGVLDAAVASAPEDWAPRYWRLRGTLSNAPAAGLPPKPAERCREDVAALLRKASLPAWTRVEVRLLEVRLENSVGDYAAALRKVQALAAEADFPDRWRALEVAVSAAGRLGHYRLARDLAEQQLAAVDARAELTREQLPDGGTLVVDPPRRRRAIYQALIELSLRLRRFDDAWRWLEAMVQRAPEPCRVHRMRAQILFHEKRYAEAKAEALRALKVEPDNRHVLRLLKKIRRKTGRH